VKLKEKHYALEFHVRMMQLTDPFYSTKCWKPECNKKTAFVFEFMGSAFPVCIEHVDEFLTILKKTYGIFLLAKGSDAK